MFIGKEKIVSALRLIAGHDGPMDPYRFARCYWPNSKGWLKKTSKGLPSGIMVSCAAALLTELVSRQLLRRDLNGYRITDLGLAVARSGTVTSCNPAPATKPRTCSPAPQPRCVAPVCEPGVPWNGWWSNGVQSYAWDGARLYVWAGTGWAPC